MSATAELLARRRLTEADRARVLREAAEAVFLRDGYAAAHMDEVARVAGMSKRTLYQHYPSKEALFEAVMQECLAPIGVDPEMENLPDLAAALRGMLMSFVRQLFEPRQIAIFRLVIAEVKRSPELADAFHRAGPGRGASSLERRLAVEMERGRLRLRDARQAARMLFTMALGAAHMWLLLGLQDAPDEAAMERVVNEAVEVFLHGALAAPTA
ncbi:TetR/AcrR family transcriptional regulator [Roseomonas eburnea]|uniref:TetR/AcrR family transcriptional regulator n=1 Tax=Neoroseomonas eburnea TaxID=1346889 RepID=A0A9X9XCV0_9PROT|nr:TetR/AcrR family transcriptional regulator [Neoroseomonas eburnea]MBR0681536.1 TetR/AcrR family transcriptional regulator [Neoroseomonas eburnea]